MPSLEDQIRLEQIKKLRGVMQPTAGVTVLPEQGTAAPAPDMLNDDATRLEMAKRLRTPATAQDPAGQNLMGAMPAYNAAPPPQEVPPSQAMVPPDRSYDARAAQLEAQAQPAPDPTAGMGTWKAMLYRGLQGAAGGAIHAQEPGGYTGYLQTQHENERQRQNDLLARAKELRGEGYNREQDFTRSQQFQQGQEQQATLAREARQQQMDLANRPQFQDFGTPSGGHFFGAVDPQSGVFSKQGEVPGAQTKPELDKNIGNYINKAGKHVEIFQKPTGETYEREFQQTREPQLGTGSYGESNVINRLQQQWDKATKDVSDLYRANTIMQSGLDAARRGDLNAGSQAILITFQKFLDPQSVVRESEYARSAQGLSMANRISGFVERLQQGGAGVTLPELETFAKLATEINANLAREGNSLLAKQAERIQRNADHFQIPSDLIFSGYDFRQNPVNPAPETPPINPGAAPSNQPKTMILGDRTLTLGPDGKYH